jgi:hypothetical protein
MKRDDTVRGLATLARLRERGVDRLSAELARKLVERERYLANLKRLDALVRADTLPVGVLHPALSNNQAGYREAVLCMADAHRAQLALHDADTAATRRSLRAEEQRREALVQVLALERGRIEQGVRRVEQARQDELGARQWLAREKTR